MHELSTNLTHVSIQDYKVELGGKSSQELSTFSLSGLPSMPDQRDRAETSKGKLGCRWIATWAMH